MHQAPATLPAPPAYIFLRELVLRFWHAYSSYYDYAVLLDSRNASIAVCTVIESPPSSIHASLPRGSPAQALVCSRCSGSTSLQTAVKKGRSYYAPALITRVYFSYYLSSEQWQLLPCRPHSRSLR